MSNLFEISNLSKKYHKTGLWEIKAVDNISLNIAKGEFLTIHGPSGSGKTTLLNLISGLDKPSAGKIVFNDQELSKLNQRQLLNFRRKNIGFVF